MDHDTHARLILKRTRVQLLSVLSTIRSQLLSYTLNYSWLACIECTMNLGTHARSIVKRTRVNLLSALSTLAIQSQLLRLHCARFI